MLVTSVTVVVIVNKLTLPYCSIRLQLHTVRRGQRN